MVAMCLYQPEIANNVGSIIRTCACFDIDLHVIEPCGFPFDLQRIKKSALDYIEHVQIIRHQSFQDFLEINQSRLILATTKTSNPYHEFDFQKEDIILFGRESAGVPSFIANAASDKITIPMKSGMRSLNLAISCAIIASYSSIKFIS